MSGDYLQWVLGDSFLLALAVTVLVLLMLGLGFSDWLGMKLAGWLLGWRDEEEVDDD